MASVYVQTGHINSSSCKFGKKTNRWPNPHLPSIRHRQIPQATHEGYANVDIVVEDLAELEVPLGVVLEELLADDKEKSPQEGNGHQCTFRRCSQIQRSVSCTPRAIHGSLANIVFTVINLLDEQ